MATSLRSETAALVRLADRDLARLWALVESGAAADEALHDLLPAIVREYGALGGVMAAEWYEEERERAEVRGRFAPVPLDASDRGAHSLVGYALSESKDDAGLKALILGGTQRRLADHVRLTVANNSVADPGAEGWVRVGQSGHCKWCDQYLDGEVRTVEGYDFDAHDNCNCSVVVAFADGSRKAAPSKPESDLGFDKQGDDWVRNQIAITEALKPSEWRTQQLARLRERLRS